MQGYDTLIHLVVFYCFRLRSLFIWIKAYLIWCGKLPNCWIMYVTNQKTGNALNACFVCIWFALLALLFFWTNGCCLCFILTRTFCVSIHVIFCICLSITVQSVYVLGTLQIRVVEKNNKKIQKLHFSLKQIYKSKAKDFLNIPGRNCSKWIILTWKADSFLLTLPNPLSVLICDKFTSYHVY